MISIKDMMSKIEMLPPFSKVANKATEILKKQDFTMQELADIVHVDASLTANILRVANSAKYTTARTITDLRLAMSIIGLEEMNEIIMKSAAKPYFNEMIDGYESYPGELWEHSLAVAILGIELQFLEPQIDTSVLYTANLLHDIGKIVLSQYVHEEYKTMLKMIQEEHVDFLTAERKVLGFTHSDVSAKVLRDWNFPEDVVLAARHHHAPEKLDNPYVNLTALADYLSMIIGKSSQKDGLHYKGHQKLLMRYKIHSNDLDRILHNVIDKIKAIEELLE